MYVTLSKQVASFGQVGMSFFLFKCVYSLERHEIWLANICWSVSKWVVVLC